MAKRHGKSGTKIHRTYIRMRQRCLNPRHKDWRHYGGRGITIDSRWCGENGFVNFAKDMGEPPTSKHTIEREDVNGPYSPDNCRWATQQEQVNNTRRNRWLTFRGRRQTLRQWCQELGLNDATVLMRLKAGRSVQAALSSPVKVQTKPPVRPCEFCQTAFQPKHRNGRFCGCRCSNLARNVSAG
jgi:hypothetical protein